MHSRTTLASLASSLWLAAAQDTSRIRSRTSTNALCTNTGTAITATMAFAPLLSVHLDADEECPQSAPLNVHYHNENDVGCCTQSAVLATAAGGGLACCPCGTACTGSVPAMVDWTFSAGQFITTTGTASFSTSTSPTGTATSSGGGSISSSSGTMSPSSPSATPTQSIPTTSSSAAPTTSPAPGSASPVNVDHPVLVAGLVAAGLGALLY